MQSVPHMLPFEVKFSLQNYFIFRLKKKNGIREGAMAQRPPAYATGDRLPTSLPPPFTSYARLSAVHGHRALVEISVTMEEVFYKK